MRQTILQVLRQKSIVVPELLLEHYARLGLSSEEFLIYLQFENCQSHIGQVASRMQISEVELLNKLQVLIQKQLVLMEQVVLPDGKIDLQYSFEPLFQKLVTLLQNLEEKEEKALADSSTAQLIEAFEVEFGRQLTPLELEMIQGWLTEDNYEIDLIRAALKEAVLSQVTNLKYIDRILLNWERKNIRTLQDAEREAQKFREAKHTGFSQTDSQIEESVLMHNWLSEGIKGEAHDK